GPWSRLSPAQRGDILMRASRLIAERAGKPIPEVTATYFAAGAYLGLDRVRAPVRDIQVADYFDRLALDRALDTLAEAERRIAAEMVANGAAGSAAVEAWVRPRAGEIERLRTALDEMAHANPTISKMTVAANLVGDLVKQ
ncbi:MAG: NAD-glutamate dehydrogenase, partial [Rhizobiales bacterium]|nr:NAD-glutamate dehydrogenase [Hyphomicrobiales bacterium]